MKKVLVCFLFVCSVFLTTPGVLSASESIKVTGFSYPRNRYSLVRPGGLPPNWDYHSGLLYKALVDGSNFGSNGIVKCEVDLKSLPFLETINSGSLVNPDGSLVADVFFGGLNEINLNPEEAGELALYLKSGGVLYLSGDVNAAGPPYNPLFVVLGANDRFSDKLVYQGQYGYSSGPPDTTPITHGPFGVVGSLKHSPYRALTLSVFDELARGYVNGEILLAENVVGKGYLSISGDPLYVDYFINDIDNYRYFLNLFALGCKEGEGNVLDVPSFKQGLRPYDDLNPFWETQEYDEGENQNLWCGQSIGQCGCALTSAAMVMRYYGVDHMPNDIWPNILVDPVSLNNYLKKDSKKIGSAYSSWGYSWGDLRWGRISELTKIANNYFPDQPKLDQPLIENFDVEKLRNYIDDRVPIILKVIRNNGGTHYVVVTGYKDNDFVINDPAMPDPIIGKETTLSSSGYTPASNDSMIRYIETHSDFSSVEIVAPAPTEIVMMDSSGKSIGETYFSESYSDPTGQNSIPPTGAGVNVADLRFALPGEYFVNVKSPAGEKYYFGVYSSDVEANSIFEVFSGTAPENGEIQYRFMYDPVEEQVLAQVVPISIHPNSERNILIAKSYSLVEVAILSSENFDAKKIKEDTLKFGESGDEESLKFCLKSKDINKDGLEDLTCFFENQKTGLNYWDANAILSGKTINETSFVGKDVVIVK